jgi:hypothetical protein
MSQFVNYHKRAFTLPPGCKDLIDVLKPSRRHPAAYATINAFRAPEIHEDHFETGGLAQIGRYVSMLFDSQSEFALTITHRNPSYEVALCRNPVEMAGIPMGAALALIVTNDSNVEGSVRTFFNQHDIQPVPEFDCFNPISKERSMIYPLPLDAPQASTLITDLLRDVYGLTGNAGLDFHYFTIPSSV